MTMTWMGRSGRSAGFAMLAVMPLMAAAAVAGRPASASAAATATGTTTTASASAAASANAKPRRAAARASAASEGAPAACFHPPYPEAARRAHAEGTTTIEFTVDRLGHTTHAAVRQPSGTDAEHALLDEAAIDDILQCPLQPGRDKAGHAVETTVQVTYKWVME